MATSRTAVVETKKTAVPQRDHPSARMLLEQYECGPIAFSGAPGALYERHVVFDHVVRLERADSRQRFEAVAWARRAIKNVGHSGRFSSDRTILEYVREIWKAKECPVDQG